MPSLKNVATSPRTDQAVKQYWGTRPFLRCQGVSLPAMRPADRIVLVSVAVVPRDRPQGTLPRPIVVVPSGRLAARGTHPA